VLPILGAGKPQFILPPRPQKLGSPRGVCLCTHNRTLVITISTNRADQCAVSITFTHSQMSDRQYRPPKSKKKNRGRGRGGARRNRPYRPNTRNHDVWVPPQRDRSPPRKTSLFDQEGPSQKKSLFTRPDREDLIITRHISRPPVRSHSRSRSQSPVRKVQVVYAVSEGESDCMQLRGIYGQRAAAQKKADELMKDSEDLMREWNVRGSDCWASNGDYVEIKLWEVE